VEQQLINYRKSGSGNIVCNCESSHGRHEAWADV